MRFYADLHIHSKYSRATSSDCDLFHLAYWARRKGITVLGTGDFTHPAWMAELKDKLVPAEPGLFRLREDLEEAVAAQLEGPCRGPTRFLLSVEISTIYKKGDKTRKIHHLLYAPDFDAADRIVRALAKIGNLNADGRPILGLDSRHLLEIVLESAPGSYLVPAHIWTPWFSVLGSKAGFDAIDDCYGDLASHIFALETGLSSDPAMNWRLSALDRYRLVSSSDAHSPPKLGREASAFDTALDYFAIRSALETGQGYLGSVEFFPEEGKYHLDGHRNCGVRLEPSETRARGERCPVCQKPLTVGVLNRVEELSDREEGARPEGAAGFQNLVPLPELLAELVGTSASSKSVERSYHGLLSRLGPELFILEQAPVEAIERAGSPLVAEAVARMRDGRVIREAGYDGAYGRIRVFEPGELDRRLSVSLFFEETEKPARKARTRKSDEHVQATKETPRAKEAKETKEAKELRATGSVLDGLDPDQRAAAEITEGPLLVIAGPGTGKTRTLTHRIAYLVAERGVPPEACLSITFTRRAAAEMRERLEALLGEAGSRVQAMTFHALGLSILREYGERAISIADEAKRIAILEQGLSLSPRKAHKILAAISRLKQVCPTRADREAKRELLPPEGSEIDRAWQIYESALASAGLVDFDDLVGQAIALCEENPATLAAIREKIRYLSIDEYQDIDDRQYRLVRLLIPEGENVCAIGDPDQAIYAFRGADVGFFLRFQEDFPAAKLARIRRNYRSTRGILEAALEVIAPSPTLGERSLVPAIEDARRVVIHEAASERAEAEFVVHTIEQMIGGSSFFSMDSGRVASSEGEAAHAFSDFAVLYRTEAQSDALAEALSRSGMPFQRRSDKRLSSRAGVEGLVRVLGEMPAAGTLVARLKEAAQRLREEVAAPAPQSLCEGEDETEEALTEASVDAALGLLVPIAERAGEDLGRFLMDVAIGREIDTWDPRAERISLLTLHASKGLEFRVVFLVGCEDGLLPLRFGIDDQSELDEERRLFYVGMTRARERLFLTHTRERARFGKRAPTKISPFLLEIEERFFERQASDAQKKPKPREDRQLKLF